MDDLSGWVGQGGPMEGAGVLPCVFEARSWDEGGQRKGGVLRMCGAEGERVMKPS